VEAEDRGIAQATITHFYAIAIPQEVPCKGREGVLAKIAHGGPNSSNAMLPQLPHVCRLRSNTRANVLRYPLASMRG
jgi:hypothetical protein